MCWLTEPVGEAVAGFGSMSASGRCGLAKAARRCSEIATRALVDLGATDLYDLVEDFGDRYVMAGRCAADEYMEELS